MSVAALEISMSEEFMGDELLDEAEASVYIRTPAATLQWWRHKGRGPTYLKVGRRIFYRSSHLDAFLTAAEIKPE
jgi:hypothetical protein